MLEKIYSIPMFWELAVHAFTSYVKGVRIPSEKTHFNNDVETVQLDK